MTINRAPTLLFKMKIRYTLPFGQHSLGHPTTFAPLSLDIPRHCRSKSTVPHYPYKEGMFRDWKTEN